MTLTIKTNNVPRWTFQFCQLDANEQQTVKDLYGYLTQEELEEQSFFKYRGDWYSLSDFLELDKNDTVFEGWDGHHSDSYFSGVLIKVIEGFMGDYDVIVGRYCS